MIDRLQTKRERDRARALAKSVLFHMDRIIKEIERLQALFNRAHDFGMQNSLAHYAIELGEIRECDGGEAGLRPFLRELLAEIKKGR